MVLSCDHISKSFVTGNVLNDCTFHIEEHEKAAIIGLNGAGKSTLLKIITGEIAPDSGTVTVSKGKTLGYLAQNQDISAGNTVMDEMLKTKQHLIDIENRLRSLENEMKDADEDSLDSLMNTYSNLNHRFELENGYAYKSEITGVLKGLGFSEEDFSKKISSLSGGQKTRVFLSRLLLLKPDIILLDEPTNHLDMGSITWLENFLLNYRGAVVIVSHDRYFLDKIVSHVIEIENHSICSFAGNYTEFAAKKEKLREVLLRHYYNNQQEIKHQKEVIEKLKSFNREKSIKRAESREKMLEKTEVVHKPVFMDSEMHLKLTPQITSGNDVLTVRGLTKSFGANCLFEELDFDIKRGEKVAIIGDNGTGKTTILKIINGLLKADSGNVIMGSRVIAGYYDQEHHVLTMENSLFDEISDAYPEMTNTEIRNVLASFLFTGEDVFKKVSELSGGERGRISLAKLMLSKSNFLILDEPTNHLDITSKEILEEAINNYDGTVLYVSHDRYFINKTSTRILELKNKKLINYIGNYDYYLEKRDELTGIYAPEICTFNDKSTENTAADSKSDWINMKEEQAKQRKIQNEIKKTEESIDKLEKLICKYDEELGNPEYSTNAGKLMEIQRNKETAGKELAQLYETWESLNDS